jgi:hypothetical protein
MQDLKTEKSEKYLEVRGHLLPKLWHLPVGTPAIDVHAPAD